MKKEFMVVFEEGEKGIGALAPDILGCFAVGSNLDETRCRFIEAAEAHLQWLATDNEPIPAPTATGFNFAPGARKRKPRYHVEWLPITMPRTHTVTKARKAA